MSKICSIITEHDGQINVKVKQHGKIKQHAYIHVKLNNMLIFWPALKIY